MTRREGDANMTAEQVGDVDFLSRAADQIRRATDVACSAAERKKAADRGIRLVLQHLRIRAAGDEIALDSLQAIELHTVLQALVVDPPPLATLRGQVRLSQIAEVLTAGTGEGGGTRERLLRVDEEGRWEPFPLTDIQQAYLLGRGGFFELGDTPAAFYAELETERLDLQRLRWALQAVVDRHDMLRAVVTVDGRQQVLPEVAPVVIGAADLREEGAQAAGAAVAALRARMTTEIGDPSRWPLFEVFVHHLPDHDLLHFSLDLLVADGVTLGLFVREWARTYRGEGLDDAPPGLSFRDYVLATQPDEESAAFQRAREYWLERVATLPPAPELPLVKAAAAVERPRFTRRGLHLDAARWGGLRRRAARRGLTPSMAVCAAFATVLARWSAHQRFTLNVTVNERAPLHPDVDRLLGDFTSLVLLETDASHGSVSEVADRLQRQFWTDMDHRAFSGVRVLRELGKSQSAGRAAMPYVFSSVLGRDLEHESLGPVRRLQDSLARVPQVMLECQVFEVGGGVQVNWDAVEELFVEGVLDSAFAAFEGLLVALSEDDLAWEDQWLELVPAAQVAVRESVNATGGDCLQELLHLLGGPLRAHGEAPAVISGAGVLSHRELEERACRIGHRLRGLGVGPNQLVGVVMHKGWEQIAAVLGILHAGGAYLPIDAGLPAERIAHLLERGEVGCVLSTAEALGSIDAGADVGRPVVGRHVLLVDDDQAWADQPTTAPVPCNQPTDLAYVIFTSGSTGEPKGVMIDHRGAVNTVADINRRHRLTGEDRVLALSSLSFDLSVWDIFGLLAAGGAVVLSDRDDERDPQAWAKLAGEHQVTVWNTVPALAEMFADHLHATARPLPATLRLVLLSGDWIPLTLPDRLRSLAADPSGLEIISLGGATEASIWSISHRIDTVDPAWRSIPYGRPLTNQTFTILDTAMRPRPDHVPGYLHIGGIGLARGYWRDPDKTAASFPTDPTTGKTLYRTGDLGRYLPDGTIEFLGRDDHQVKINGYRIELGEIEHTLLTHPAVKDAVVTVTDHQLTAYLVPAAGADLAVPDVRQHAVGRLPSYMVPSRWMPLDALPLSANGKVDRGALPEPTVPTSPSLAGSVPQGDRETLVAAIWEEVLNVAPVARYVPFADYGGTSMSALQVLRRLAAQGWRARPRDLMSAPTIAELAALLQPVDPAPSATPELGRSASAVEVPLLPWQAEFLAFSPTSWSNYAQLYDVHRHLDGTALRVAVRELLNAHPALRSGFVQDDQGWHQVLHPSDGVPTPFEVVDLPVESDSELEARIQHEHERFDLKCAPLFKVVLFRAPDQTRLLLLVHQLVADFYSCTLLIGDLLSAHDGVLRTGTGGIPMDGYVDWTRRLTASAAEHASEIIFADAPASGLLESGPTSAASVFSVKGQVSGDPEAILIQAVAETFMGLGLTTANICVDQHGREPADDLVPADVVGRLSVSFPVRLELAGGPPVRDQIDHQLKAVRPRARERALASIHNSQYGGPLGFDAAVNYLGQGSLLRSVEGLQPSSLFPGRNRDPRQPAKAPLEVLATQLSGSLVVGVRNSSHHPELHEILIRRVRCLVSGTASEEAADATGSDDDRTLADWLRRGAW